MAQIESYTDNQLINDLQRIQDREQLSEWDLDRFCSAVQQLLDKNEYLRNVIAGLIYETPNTEPLNYKDPNHEVQQLLHDLDFCSTEDEWSIAVKAFATARRDAARKAIARLWQRYNPTLKKDG